MKRAFLALSLQLTMVFLFSACAPSMPHIAEVPEDAIVIQPGETIKIALVTDLVDGEPGLSRIGIDIRAGAITAVTTNPFIGDFRIELVPLETACNEESGQTVAEVITSSPEIAAAVGYTCSASCRGSTPVFQDAGLTLMAAGCSDSNLTEVITHQHAFSRVFYDDRHESRLAADYAFFNMGSRSAIIVQDSSIESQNLSSGFETVYAMNGGEILAVRTFLPGAGQTSLLMTDILELSPDLIYAPMFPGVSAEFITELRSRNPNARIMTSRWTWTNWFIDNMMPEHSENIYSVGPIVATDELEVLKDAYLRVVPGEQPGVMFAFGYDAASMLIKAIQETASLNRDGDLVIVREKVENALHTSVDVEAVTGNLTCTEYGECSADVLGIGSVQDGEWVTVFVP